jgi:Spy/CpxP family protein refolding chaperone
MKKLIIAVLLFTSIFSFAQEVQTENKDKKVKREKMSPEQRNQFLLDKMTKELNLDAQQQEQIKPIIAEQNAKMQEMREQGKVVDFKEMSKEERKALMQKRNEEKTVKENKLKAILTPEQFKKMKEMEAANREKMVEARKARQNQQEQGF